MIFDSLNTLKCQSNYLMTWYIDLNRFGCCYVVAYVSIIVSFSASSVSSINPFRPNSRETHSCTLILPYSVNPCTALTSRKLHNDCHGKLLLHKVTFSVTIWKRRVAYPNGSESEPQILLGIELLCSALLTRGLKVQYTPEFKCSFYWPPTVWIMCVWCSTLRQNKRVVTETELLCPTPVFLSFKTLLFLIRFFLNVFLCCNVFAKLILNGILNIFFIPQHACLKLTTNAANCCFLCYFRGSVCL